MLFVLSLNSKEFMFYFENFLSQFYKNQKSYDNFFIDCDCYQPGTNNGLISCTEEGHCNCKTFVDGNKCKSCDDGYYRLSQTNMMGCTGRWSNLSFEPFVHLESKFDIYIQDF